MRFQRLLIIYILSLVSVGAFILIKTEDNQLSQISFALPGVQTAPLPNLSPLAIYDLRLSQLNGRRILRFSASFVNKGKAQFELIGDPNITGDGFRNVYQRIIKEDGSFESKLVGNFEWHEIHDHYHYGDFAEYVFSPVKLALDNSQAPLAIRQKVTFCLRDNALEMPELEGASQRKVFTNCDQNRQGVSIGWTDIYDYTLPDQYIDVQDMPAGIYQLSFFLDSHQRFTEESKADNISTIFFELNPVQNLVKPIASAAPFFTHHNSFPDNFLIHAGGDTKVYVLHNNKKRWLKTAEIFNSYSHPWDRIYSLTKSMVDAIPFNNLIRVQGREEVYALNDLGYKRHILNPTVFSSYQFTGPDVADINETEFASYPYSNLIRVVGDGDIYLISEASKKKMGKIDYIQSLGYDLNSIHTVNQTDFDAYSTQ